MAKSKISQLPQYTGDTTGVYLLMDNANQTQTFKVLKEDIITNITLPTGLVSSSNQISYTGLTNIPNGIISGSSQVLNGSGIISSSTQLTASMDVRYLNVTGENVVSSSSQISYTGITNVPSGIVSGSAQSTTWGYLTTSSFNTVSGSLDSRLDAVELLSSSLTVAANSTTKILDSVSYTNASSWTATYAGNGGSVKVEANFTAYASSTGGKTMTLYRDGVAVDTGYFYFNTANVHATMPTLYYIGTNEIGSHTYSIGVNSGVLIDPQDYASIIVTEVFNALITGSLNYVQVLGDRRAGITSSGTAIISGSITTKGNPIQIIVTGDANPIGASGWARLQLYRNSTPIGNIVQAENGSNLNIPYCLNIIDNPGAGTYTYYMKTGTMSGTIDFGEASGPTLTMIELGSIAQMASLGYAITGSNTFNGDQTITGQINVGTSSGNEGGQINLALAQTNQTLTGSVNIDVYQNRLRFWEGGGNARGVSIDLSKAPNSVNADLLWKMSGIVNAGTFVTLDNIKATVTTSGNRGLSLATVSGTVTGYVSGQYQVMTGGGGAGASSTSLSTSATTSLFSWNFTSEGDTATYILRDNTNNRVYRIIMIIGGAYNNNFISIERLY